MLPFKNQDFGTSVSMTTFAMETLFPLEVTADRLTALMKLPKGADIPTDNIQAALKLLTEHSLEVNTQQWSGIEMLILEGTCRVNKTSHTLDSYLRLPTTKDIKITAASDCIIFIKYNQFLEGDRGDRIINTRQPEKWLPGPVEGIEIRPLHVFDTESIMLLRWHHAAEFKPRLNPRGEEILVMNGLLQNRDHLYRQFSWIRNPIEDWRKWHGNTGTLAYYKSGHFPDDPKRNNDSPKSPQSNSD